MFLAETKLQHILNPIRRASFQFHSHLDTGSGKFVNNLHPFFQLVPLLLSFHFFFLTCNNFLPFFVITCPLSNPISVTMTVFNLRFFIPFKIFMSVFLHAKNNQHKQGVFEVLLLRFRKTFVVQKRLLSYQNVLWGRIINCSCKVSQNKVRS